MRSRADYTPWNRLPGAYNLAMAILLEIHTALATEQDAISIGHRLVTERLAACAQVLPGLTSIYTWEDKLRQEPEVLLLLKTTEETWPALRDRLAELHPYDTPEIIALTIDHASFDYVTWVRENCEF